MKTTSADLSISSLSYAAGLSLLMLGASAANFLPKSDPQNSNSPAQEQVGEIFMELEQSKPEPEAKTTNEPEIETPPEVSELIEQAQEQLQELSEFEQITPAPVVEEVPLIEPLPAPTIKPKVTKKPTPSPKKKSSQTQQKTQKKSSPPQKKPQQAAPKKPQPAKPAIQVFRGGGRNFPQPSYPRSAQQRKQQGTVTLYVEVNAQGRPTTVSVHRSSGHRVLDLEAQKTIKRWRWSSGPARYHVPVSFQLR